MTSLICGILKKNTNELFVGQKQTHGLWKQTYSYQSWGGGDGLQVWDWHMHTVVYEMTVQ